LLLLFKRKGPTICSTLCVYEMLFFCSCVLVSNVVNSRFLLYHLFTTVVCCCCSSLFVMCLSWSSSVFSALVRWVVCLVFHVVKNCVDVCVLLQLIERLMPTSCVVMKRTGYVVKVGFCVLGYTNHTTATSHRKRSQSQQEHKLV